MERNLNDVLGNAFYAQEQEEAKSRQIEDLIKSYKGASALLPPRQYGKPINPEKFVGRFVGRFNNRFQIFAVIGCHSSSFRIKNDSTPSVSRNILICSQNYFKASKKKLYQELNFT